MSSLAQTLVLGLAASAGAQKPEVWYRNHSSLWPSAPAGHYVGPDSRVLSPAEFADYASNPRKLVLVFGAQDGASGQ